MVIRLDRVRQQHDSSTTAGNVPEHREQIFDRFFRADPSRTGGGHGLGLSLAREFARAHGGDVTLLETGPEGAVFELTLPAAPEASS